MIRSIKLGLAGLAFAALSLFLPAAAQAADYNGPCGAYPGGSFVNVTITDGGDCLIMSNITASGAVSINAPNGSIRAAGITSGAGGIFVQSGLDQTFTGTVHSAAHGGIALISQGGKITAPTLTATLSSIGVEAAQAVTINGPVTTTAGNIELVSRMAGLQVFGTISTTGGLIDLSTGGSGGNLETTTISGSNNNILVAATGSNSFVILGAITDNTGYVSINATDKVTVNGAIKTTGGGSTPGNVLIQAGSTLQTGAITTSLGGIVDLHAQTNGGSSVFTIGGSGQTNGVNGLITTTGSGDDPLLPSAVVYVSNPGGITLTATTNISVAGASSSNKAGNVILNAGSGTITIPAGTMSASSTGGAGQINLLASQISASGAVILNAGQTATPTATNHQINIAAATISYGTSLTLNANGNATDTTAALEGLVSLVPQGAITVTDNNSNPANIQISLSTASTPTGALSITSTATGTLLVEANGNNTQAQILANPISIGGKIVTIESQGANNHGVTINNPVLTFATGLTLSSSTSVTIDASGSVTWGTNPAGGVISTNLDPAVLSSPTLIFNANGSATTGGAPGGSVSLTSANFQLGANSTATITANGSGTGDGANAGSISLVSGGLSPINLGTANGDFSLSVQATGTDGNGGNIALTTVSANPVMLTHGVSLAANGAGTGIGGNVLVANAAVPAPIPPATVSNIDVNQVVSVNAGPGINGGSISINGITCQQQTVSTANSWPAAYWDCTNINPSVVPIVPQTAVALLEPSTVIAVFNTANVQLYTMNSISDWNAFFGSNPQNTSPTDRGETVVDSANSYVASAVFVNEGNGTANPYPNSETAYQLGHAFDLLSGSLSAGTAFNSAVTTDFSDSGLMNTTLCSTVFSFNPAVCSQYSGHTNTYIFEQLFFSGGGVQPSNAILFENSFELLEADGNTTPGLESAMAFLTQINAYMQSVTGIPGPVGLVSITGGNAVIGGSVTTANKVTITINNAGLTGGLVSTTYTVVAGDTLATIATKLAAALNSNTALQNIGIAASASSTTVSLTAASYAHPTTFTTSLSPVGATETIQFTANTSWPYGGVSVVASSDPATQKGAGAAVNALVNLQFTAPDAYAKIKAYNPPNPAGTPEFFFFLNSSDSAGYFFAHPNLQAPPPGL